MMLNVDVTSDVWDERKISEFNMPWGEITSLYGTFPSVCVSALSSVRVMENWQIPIKLIPAATDFMAKKASEDDSWLEGNISCFSSDGYQFLGWMQTQRVSGWVQADGRIEVSVGKCGKGKGLHFSWIVKKVY